MLKKIKENKHLLFVVLIPLALIGLAVAQNNNIKKSQGGQASCQSLSARPCYDKQTRNLVEIKKQTDKSSNTIVLGLKAGEQAFEACTKNQDSNSSNELSMSTSFCAKEAYQVCYEGKSQILVRKFNGMCKPSSENECAALEKTQQFYFDVCAQNGYDNVCFDIFTSEYQGCTRDAWNDCSVHNGNAYRNILCNADILEPALQQ